MLFFVFAYPLAPQLLACYLAIDYHLAMWVREQVLLPFVPMWECPSHESLVKVECKVVSHVMTSGIFHFSWCSFLCSDSVGHETRSKVRTLDATWIHCRDGEAVAQGMCGGSQSFCVCMCVPNLPRFDSF